MGDQLKNKRCLSQFLLILGCLCLIGPARGEEFAKKTARVHLAPALVAQFSYPAEWIEKPPRGNPNVVIKVSSNRDNKATCYLEAIQNHSPPSPDRSLELMHAELNAQFQNWDVLNTVVDPHSGVYLHARIRTESFGSTSEIDNLRSRHYRRHTQITFVCGAISRYVNQADGRLRKQLQAILMSLELIEED